MDGISGLLARQQQQHILIACISTAVGATRWRAMCISTILRSPSLPSKVWIANDVILLWKMSIDYYRSGVSRAESCNTYTLFYEAVGNISFIPCSPLVELHRSRSVSQVAFHFSGRYGIHIILQNKEETKLSRDLGLV